MAGEAICSITFQGGGIRDGQVASGAGIQAEKVVQQYTIGKLLTTDDVTAIAATTKTLLIVKGLTGTVMGFEAVIQTTATGADRTVTVDLQKSTGGAAFATILSSTIGFNNTSSPRIKSSGVISTSSVIAGDVLRAVVTVVGAAGAQAIGLQCSLTMQERLS